MAPWLGLARVPLLVQRLRGHTIAYYSHRACAPAGLALLTFTAGAATRLLTDTSHRDQGRGRPSTGTSRAPPSSSLRQLGHRPAHTYIGHRHQHAARPPHRATQLGGRHACLLTAQGSRCTPRRGRGGVGLPGRPAPPLT
eukprot:scaffold94218_cov37-Phaeocystis_antarctica.AAC.1